MESMMNGRWRRGTGRGLLLVLGRRLGLWPLLMLLMISDFALAGDCRPWQGAPPQDFSFDFNTQFNSPDENASLRIMPNAHSWDLGRLYTITCDCGIESRPGINFTAVSALPAGRSGVVNGTSMQFFQLNPNLQVAGEIWIGGGRQEYVPYPFANEANLYRNWPDCDPIWAVFNNVQSGSMGRLHLMIDRPFVGVSIIPRTRLVSLTAAIDRAPSASAESIVEVYMSGRVVVPQSCRLAPGQNTVVDFGSITRAEIMGPAQSPLRVESRTFQIQCVASAETVLVELSLSGTPHVREPGLLAVNNRDDLAIALRSGNRSIAPLPPQGLTRPTPGQIVPIQIRQPQQDGSFDLQAYPVRMAEQLEAGPFSSHVTLKFEFR